MALTQRRATQRRTFHGEQEADAFLADLQNLNGRPRSRVIEVLNLVQKAAALSLQLEKAGKVVDYESPEMAEMETLVDPKGRLNSILSKYQVHPSVYRYGVLVSGRSPSLRRPRFSGNARADKLDFSFVSVNRQRDAEVAAVLDIIRLADLRVVNQVRQCTYCGKWLFARFSHQTHCSGGDCRIGEFRESPRWKEYRRTKGREYYKLHMTKNVK